MRSAHWRRWHRRHRLHHRQHFGRRSVFVKLLVVFIATGFAVAGLFGLLSRQIWKPSPTVLSAVQVNFDYFAEDLIRQMGDPPTRATLERVSRERFFAIRVDGGPEGTLMSEPGLPDPQQLKIWTPRPLPDLQLSRDDSRMSAILHKGPRTYVLSIERDPMPFLRWTWWLGWIGASLLVLGLAFGRVRRMFQPLHSLLEGAEAISAGNLEFRLKETGQDELGHLQRAFNRMAARIQRMIQGREQLLRDVSHELRSPLARVKVAAAMLPDSRMRESVEEDVRELESLVDLLLERSRLEADAPLQATVFDLTALLEEFRLRYADRGPGVEWKGGLPAELWICADRERIRTAVRNLLENAAKYAGAAPRPTQLSILAQGGFELRDFGPGVPPVDAERIFDPFQRGDAARTRNPNDSGGFGLGLDLARRIARAHGGDLVLQNPDSGNGAVFRLTLDSRRVSTKP